MIFNSLEFLIFFPIVLLVYYLIPNKVRHIWLLIASYYFYMSWNAKYALLMLIATVVTYFAGILITKFRYSGEERPIKIKKTKLVVACSLVVTLGLLFHFKYSNFIIESFDLILNKIGYKLNIPKFDIILPIGISFFTLQSIGYVIDVYRNKKVAEYDFFRYALFISFFPQLIAGPIERSTDLLRQLKHPKKFDFYRIRDGFLLMLWGFFLKIVIADRIAIFVDTVYGDYNTYGGLYLVVATVLFAFQIYCDFVGYTTIAMGSARMLGIDLIDNFNAPYLSRSISEFWRRWHISLSTWFRDYLYIPLGGSQYPREYKYKTYINKFITFLVSGLWHGANLTFIIWGGLNGLFQVIEETTQPLRDKVTKTLQLNKESFSHKLLKTIVTFVLIDFTWIFFRAETCTDAFNIIKSMVTVYNPWILLDGSLYTCGLDMRNYSVMIYGIILLMLVDVCKYNSIIVRKFIIKQDYWFRWILVSVSIVLILTLGIWGPEYIANNFIYFQF